MEERKRCELETSIGGIVDRSKATEEVELNVKNFNHHYEEILRIMNS